MSYSSSREDIAEGVPASELNPSSTFPPAFVKSRRSLGVSDGP